MASLMIVRLVPQASRRQSVSRLLNGAPSRFREGSPRDTTMPAWPWWWSNSTASAAKRPPPNATPGPSIWRNAAVWPHRRRVMRWVARQTQRSARTRRPALSRPERTVFLPRAESRVPQSRWPPCRQHQRYERPPTPPVCELLHVRARAARQSVRPPAIKFGKRTHDALVR